MEMTINIEDYVTPEDIKDEALYVIRSELARQYHNNESEINRLITKVYRINHGWDAESALTISPNFNNTWDKISKGEKNIENLCNT